MAIQPSGIIDQGQLREAIQRAQEKLNPNEVRLVRYSIGVDSTGETTILFRILLSDSASQESHLGEVTGRIATIFFDEIKPWENWGILPEFNFVANLSRDDVMMPPGLKSWPITTTCSTYPTN